MTASATIPQGTLRQQSFIEKLLAKKLFWLIFCGFFFGYPIVRSLNRELPPPLPVLFELPQYELVNQFGNKFGSNDLKGKIYLANFAFTSCPSVCPDLMGTMQKVQKRVRGLGTEIAIVTYSVDPETDTPDVLLKYSREWKANPFVWFFLTGEKESMKNILIDGYKVAMGDRDKTDSMYDIAHSNKVALVDEQGRIRGYYNTDKNDINRLMIDVGLMINRDES